ncbi:MAG: elongation factor Ts [Candidatus Paceibacterota bacterium]|nr:MAG: elongation factor Ts [Candidatus Paceibacterota bacterium]
MISTDQVKELRDKTGISIMQCRKALEEAGGDMGKAQIILQKQSKAVAEKKSDRELNAGVIQAYIHSNGSVGAMLELTCETDFVSKNEEFKNLAYDLAMQVAATNPKYLSKEDISQEAKKEAAEVFSKEVADKPDELKEKILSGKLDAFFAEQILLEQPFIKNPDIKIVGLIESAVQKFGEKIRISRFSRFSI